MARKKKKKESPVDEYDPLEAYADPADDGAFESKNTEIHKYSLMYKLKHFIEMHKKPVAHTVEEGDDDSSEFQQSFMGDSANLGKTRVGTGSPDKPLLFRFRWYELLAIVVEILLVLYVILVLFRVVPIF